MLLQPSRLATSSTSVIEVMHGYTDVVDLIMPDTFSDLTTLPVATGSVDCIQTSYLCFMMKTCKCDLRSTFVKKKQAVSKTHTISS